MFSAIDSSGISASSWWMMTMPAASLCRMSCELARLALEDDVAVVGAVRVDAGQHLHQRGLAGAVLPADRVDLAAVDGEADVLSALTPGNSLVMERISRIGWLMSTASSVSDGESGEGWCRGAVGVPARPGHRTAWVTSGRRRCSSRCRREPSARCPWSTDDRVEQVGRDDLGAVVVGLRVVDLGLLVGTDGLDHRDGDLGEVAGVLEDGEYCSPARIDLTDCTSASWPVTTGSFLPPPP